MSPVIDRAEWVQLARCHWRLGARDSFRNCLAKAKACPPTSRPRPAMFVGGNEQQNGAAA